MRLGWMLVLAGGCYDPLFGEAVGGDGEDTEVATGFPADVQAVFSTSCAGSGCHWGGSMAPKLSDGYDAVVGVASGVGANYIEPSDAGGSYLLAKVKGTQADLGGGGNQMPIGSTLSEADIATLTAWIDAGAPREE